MGAGAEKEQLGLGFCHKIVMGSRVYFKQEIQSNNLLWPKKYVGIDPYKHLHLYTCKGLYVCDVHNKGGCRRGFETCYVFADSIIF